MSLTRTVLKKRVADFLGYTNDSTKWSDIQSDRMDRIIDKGYQEYLHPPRIDQYNEPHFWGFLRGSYQFDTTANTHLYNLPSNFGYIVGPMTFLTQERYYETYIKLVGWGDILIHQTAGVSSTATGLPVQYAIDMAWSNTPGTGSHDTNNFWYEEVTTPPSAGFYWPVMLTAEEAALFDLDAGGSGTYSTVNFSEFGTLDFYQPTTGATTANVTNDAPASYTSLDQYMDNPDSFPDVDWDQDQLTSGGKMSLFPTPDKQYTIFFQYQKSATTFGNDPLGPDDFHILLEECVLSHAEKDLSDAYGIHRQTYMELLERFIEHDKRMYPETFQNIGQMREYPYQTQHGQFGTDPRHSLNNFTIGHDNNSP